MSLSRFSVTSLPVQCASLLVIISHCAAREKQVHLRVMFLSNAIHREITLSSRQQSDLTQEGMETAKFTDRVVSSVYIKYNTISKI